MSGGGGRGGSLDNGRRAAGGGKSGSSSPSFHCLHRTEVAEVHAAAAVVLQGAMSFLCLIFSHSNSSILQFGLSQWPPSSVPIGVEKKTQRNPADAGDGAEEDGDAGQGADGRAAQLALHPLGHEPLPEGGDAIRPLDRLRVDHYPHHYRFERSFKHLE